MTSVDNPLNGFVEGYCESEDLGVFILTPRALQFNNFAPNQYQIWYLMEAGNNFYKERLDFDTDTL